VASIERPKTKSAQASRGFAPDPLTRGFAPGLRWGLGPQIPAIGSRYHAYHGAMPSPRCSELEPPLLQDKCDVMLCVYERNK